MSKGLVVVETTLPDGPDSERVVAGLVEDRLAACANWERIRSAYWWDGQVEHAEEIHVSFKTSQEALDRLVKALGQRHPYDVPFIAWSAVEDVVDDYTAWVEEETKGGSKSNPSD